jgi:predicted RNA binding protein YcfA (HicA-like mRNA interferase family)
MRARKLTGVPALSAEAVVRILEKKGFRLLRTKGSHHTFLDPESRRTVVVPVHHHDLAHRTCAEIFREAGITREEIEELLE